MKFTVETVVEADLDAVWNAWNNPEDIKQWNAASDDWHTTESTVDLRNGGRFLARMDWLHASWSLGATLGPLVMTGAVAWWNDWEAGYLAVAAILSCLMLLFVVWAQGRERSLDQPSSAAGPMSSRALRRHPRNTLLVKIAY